VKKRRYSKRKDSLSRTYVLDTKTGRRAKASLWDRESKRRKKSKISSPPARGRKRFISLEQKEIKKLRKQLQRERKQSADALAKQEEFFKTVVKEQIQPYSRLIALENLPEAQVNETEDEHAKRIVAAIVRQGRYTAEEAYGSVAEHTGLSRSRVYTLFIYLTNYGEYVA
jgi:hypothetical protein